MEETLVARWESRGGRYVVELHKPNGSGYYYRGDGCGGYLGNDLTLAEAFKNIDDLTKGNAGYFHSGSTDMALTIDNRARYLQFPGFPAIRGIGDPIVEQR